MKDRKEKILDDLYIDKLMSEKLINDFEEKIELYTVYINEENKKISEINEIIRKLG